MSTSSLAPRPSPTNGVYWREADAARRPPERSTWRTPHSRDLDSGERARVRKLQIWLRCVKLCPTCHILLPIELFADIDQPCEPCVAEHASDTARAGHAARHRVYRQPAMYA